MENISRLQKESERKIRNLQHISSQQKLHKARQLEREVLQNESSQRKFFGCKTLIDELTPELKKELTLRKSISYMNPSKHEKLSPDCIYDYQNIPDKQLKILLTPTVIVGDYSAFAYQL